MKRHRIISIVAIIVMIVAVIIAIVMADSRDALVDMVNELEILNRRYLAENSCFRAKLSEVSEDLSNQIKQIGHLNYLISEKDKFIIEVQPYHLKIWESTRQGCYCTQISPWLEKNRKKIYEFYLWANENVSDTNVKPIDIKFPDGGEILEGGSQCMIVWKSAMLDGSVRIEFYNGNSWTVISDRTENDGKYKWHVPHRISTRKGRIYIEDITPMRVRHVDYSRDCFTIAETSNE